MLVEWDTPPEVAFTVTGYDPAGVPVVGLSCGGELAPFPTTPHAAIPAAVTNRNDKSRRGAKRLTRPPEATNTNPVRAISIPATSGNGRIGSEPWGGFVVEAAEWGVVVMERVTICEDAPGVTGFVGAKVAFAPAGSGVAGEMLSVTGSENMPFEGERVNAN